MALGLLRFTNAAGGTADFIYPGPAIDMQSPYSAGAISGTTYLNYAQSFDMSQWEISTGAATLSGGIWTFARTAVLANSLGTTAKINFSTPPQVFAFDLLDAEYVSALMAQSFTAKQQDRARRNISVPMFRVPFTAGGLLKAFGDSITVGNGASVAATYGYIQRFAQYLQATLTNAAVSGTGSNSICWTSFSTLAKFNRPRELVTWMGSHNDIYRGGSNPKTISKLKGELRAFIANAYLATAFAADDASLTKTGTWANGSGIREKAAASLGGHLMFSQTVNDTITGSFTGDTLVVGCFNADGVSLHVGTFTVSVDGATTGQGFATYNGDGLADGISDTVYDNKLTHDVVVLSGLGVGSHTFTIKLTVASGSFPVYIDYVGTLVRPVLAGPVIVWESSRPDATGYATLGGGVWSDAAFDLADAAINAVAGEFYNYPVAVARTSFYQNTTTDISTDHEHPNNLGHFHLEQAGREVIDLARLQFQRGGRLRKSANQSIANAAYVAVSFDTSDYDDDGLHNNVTNNTRVTAADAGTFRFSGYVGFDVSATGQRFVSYRKNGGAPVDVSCILANTGSQTTIIPFRFEIDLAQGDYIELLAVQNSGGALNLLAANTQFLFEQVR